MISLYVNYAVITVILFLPKCIELVSAGRNFFMSKNPPPPIFVEILVDDSLVFTAQIVKATKNRQM